MKILNSEGFDRPNRRIVLAGVFAGLLSAVLPRQAAANSVSRAQDLVNSISSELTRVVNSGRSETQLYRDFERILSTYGDMPVVSASVLGRPWKAASRAQKTAYVSAFQSYIATKYGRQFGEFKGTEIRVTGGRDYGSKGVLVNTVAVRPGRENVKVDWQISERSGKPKAVNLFIEGVSMLSNEKKEIGVMLDAQGGSIDGLVAELNRRS